MLKCYIIRALNIRVYNTQRQTKLVHDINKDSLDNILDINIDDIMIKTVYPKPRSLKEDTLIIQSCTPKMLRSSSYE